MIGEISASEIVKCNPVDVEQSNEVVEQSVLEKHVTGLAQKTLSRVDEQTNSSCLENKHVKKNVKFVVCKKRIKKEVGKDVSTLRVGRLKEEVSSDVCKTSEEKDVQAVSSSGNKRLLDDALAVQLEKKSKLVEENPSFTSIAQCKEELENLAKSLKKEVSPCLSFVKRAFFSLYFNTKLVPSLKKCMDYESIASLLKSVSDSIKNFSKTSGVDPILLKKVTDKLDAFGNRISKNIAIY